MRYKIRKNNETPAYLQLYEYIKFDIIKGIYPFEQKLPSKRDLAQSCNVSLITVTHALELLCEEGYIKSRQRSGYYVSFKFYDGFASSASDEMSHIGSHNITRRVSNDMTSSKEMKFPYSTFTKTMRRVMSDYGEDILKNCPNEGCYELREQIRLYLARNRGIYVDSSQIIIGSGAEYLYSVIAMIFKDIFSDKMMFAIESPSYEKIEQVYKSLDVKLDLLPLVKDGVDLKALSNTKAKVLHISPYRSYPTGITASASKRFEYLAWAGTDKYIVEDDFESEFSVSRKSEETLFAMSCEENVIYMNTFSKTISASLRLGYMVLPKKLISVYNKKMGFKSCTVPTFEQLVIAQLIKCGDFERHINRVRRYKRNLLSTDKE